MLLSAVVATLLVRQEYDVMSWLGWHRLPFGQ